ncbi:MAG: glycosyltransferase family 1 protein [Candidatus Latescibacteria bacterium]|nr:glycosyltransferase family 1 protein [Candidatus Latescibacterota bacterium]
MPRPIRILRIIDRLNVGGPTHQVTLLTRRLEERGYRTTLVKGCVAPGEVEMTDVIAEAGVRPVQVSTLGRAISWLDDPASLIALCRLIRQVRPDVVHTHKSKAGTLGRIAARLTGVPVVVHTFHGHVFRGYFSPARSAAVVLVERLLGAWTDAVVAISPAQRRDLLSYGIAPPERMRCIPLGLRLDRFRSADRLAGQFRAEIGVTPDQPLVGFVGRLVPIKGVEVFLKAAARVLKRFPVARFVVVGDGERRPALEAEAEALGIAKAVRFTGYRQDTDRVYASLDLFVLSSFNEGLPVTIIEALAAGCYVVAARVGGVPDLLTSDRLGLAVASGDPVALSEAMIRALSERRRISEEDRDATYQRYGIDRLVEDLDGLYRSLLKCKGCKLEGFREDKDV